MTEHPVLTWTDDRPEINSDAIHTAIWRSEASDPSSKRVVTADDYITADMVYCLVCEGTALLW